MIGVCEPTELKSGRLAAISGTDPTIIAPDIYKVVFENELIRVLEVSMSVGAQSAMHSHPDYLMYPLTSCRVEFTSPDGIAQAFAIEAGTSQHRDAECHSVKNVGNTECRVLCIEFKKAA